MSTDDVSTEEASGLGYQLNASFNEVESPPAPPHRKGLNFISTVLAYISTIVGGGIVGLPYAFYHTGITLGIALNVVVVVLTVYSC